MAAFKKHSINFYDKREQMVVSKKAKKLKNQMCMKFCEFSSELAENIKVQKC